ncbi:hypothetical protein [Thermomonospora cellulosilytica]|uniref:DUF4873 domain-containing protein n=1 Tax=Thermomonospora cellulosilytica TaxID=1411118 RepID=A0A7W3R8M5_9ACTN|nr:hypothetical protein [Thermomonospora cellulosilytica]MBA9003749.1 hypothetical protein [Thermomonospora cellulosilytica]
MDYQGPATLTIDGVDYDVTADLYRKDGGWRGVVTGHDIAVAAFLHYDDVRRYQLRLPNGRAGEVVFRGSTFTVADHAAETRSQSMIIEGTGPAPFDTGPVDNR